MLRAGGWQGAGGGGGGRPQVTCCGVGTPEAPALGDVVMQTNDKRNQGVVVMPVIPALGG